MTMSFSMDTNTSRALIIGASEFPKDSSLLPVSKVISNTKSFSEILSNEKIVGLSQDQIHISENEQDNTAIKEQLAFTAEKGGSTLILYYTGHVIIRKGQLYLATVNSSLRQIHVNGIPLSELMSIVAESDTTQKIIILDAVYSHAPNDPKEDTEKLVKNIFNHYEQEYPDTYLISSPSTNYTTEAESNFTHQFVQVLSQGIPEEKGTLTLQDIYDALSSLSEQENNIGFPIFGKKGRKSTITFAYNHQFIRFRDLRKQADKLFEEGNYSEVLPLYRDASSLFPENEYINKKLQFTSHFLLASEMFANKEYAEAKKNFEEAKNFFDLPVVNDRINDCVEKLASQLYDQGDFEQALPYYEYLVKNSESNIFYNRRLKVCQDEIRFHELIDKADRAYFEDDYAEALRNYNAALEINLDNLVVRRKEECERFLEKEKTLREKLRKEIAENMLQEQEAIIAEKIASEEGKLDEKLKEKETKLIAEVRKEAHEAFEEKLKEKLNEFENSFWKRLSVWNDVEGYRFYLDFFSEGNFVKKAKKRIKQLEERNQQIETLQTEHKIYREEEDKSLNGSHTHSPVEPSSMDEESDTAHDTETEKEDYKSNAERISLADLIKPTNFDEEAESIENQFSEEAETQEIETPEIDSTYQAPEEMDFSENEEKSVSNEEVEQPTENEVSADYDPIPQDASEEELWQYACSVNTVASYMNYINNTQESSYIAEAYTKVGELSRLETDDNENSVSEASGNEVESSLDEASDEEANVENDIVEEQQPFTSHVENEVHASEEDTPSEELGQGIGEVETEEELWATAEKENTVESYMHYIENSDEGSFISEAYYRINNLNTQANMQNEAVTGGDSTEQAESFTVEEKNNSIPDFSTPSDEIETNHEFTSQNGHAEQHETATFTETSTEIEEETLWQRTKSEDTVSAYFSYMNKTTEKRYWDEAKSRISELKNSSQSQELDDWNEAQEEDTVEAYKRYIRKYPLGNYYAKAMFRLNRLES